MKQEGESSDTPVPTEIAFTRLRAATIASEKAFVSIEQGKGPVNVLGMMARKGFWHMRTAVAG